MLENLSPRLHLTHEQLLSHLLIFAGKTATCSTRQWQGGTQLFHIHKAWNKWSHVFCISKIIPRVCWQVELLTVVEGGATSDCTTWKVRSSDVQSATKEEEKTNHHDEPQSPSQLVTVGKHDNDCKDHKLDAMLGRNEALNVSVHVWEPRENEDHQQLSENPKSNWNECTSQKDTCHEDCDHVLDRTQ